MGVQYFPIAWFNKYKHLLAFAQSLHNKHSHNSAVSSTTKDLYLDKVPS